MPKLLFFLITLSVLAVSCRRHNKQQDDVLLRYGDLELSQSEVLAMIPDGIPASDSVALFSSIVDSWIRNAVLADFAKDKLPDTYSIDRRVNDYRNSLIVEEYLRRMRESKPPVTDENRVRDYYNQHKKELKLEVPLVKGIFMKVNSETKGRDIIKNLITSDKPEDIDKLEQEWLDRALEYIYFRDKWMDWETLTGKVPYRFGDPDKFLSENGYFETVYGDCAYYIRFYEYLPSGEEQPFDFASTWIAGILSQADLVRYEEDLVKSIVDKSIKENKLELVGYDPFRHELKETHVKEKDEYK